MAISKLSDREPRANMRVGGHDVPLWVVQRLKPDSVICVEEEFLDDAVRWFVDGVEIKPPASPERR